jgi:histidinol-phosphate aminotransferase
MKALSQLVRKNIQELKPYSSARDEFSQLEGIFIDANENPFGHYNRYPDPYQVTLKQELSRQKDIPMENIFIGNGSDEVIDLLIRIFCEPGLDKALTFVPTYGMYKVSSQINDVELIEIPLDSSFQIDFNRFIPYADDEKLKLIFICSPNNPTGNKMDKNTIVQIIESFNGIVVIDEAYIDFTSEKSCLELLSLYPHLVVLQTLSKAWGQAGLRIGCGFASQEIIAFFNKVKPPYNISKANQSLALTALQNWRLFQKNKKRILSEREKVVAALKPLPIIKRIFPSSTNFILIQMEDANEVYQKLVKEKIVVRNRSSQIEDALRITIGSPQENKKMIEILQKIANEKNIISR